jgi:hypothetical protein
LRCLKSIRPEQRLLRDNMEFVVSARLAHGVHRLRDDAAHHFHAARAGLCSGRIGSIRALLCPPHVGWQTT